MTVNCNSLQLIFNILFHFPGECSRQACWFQVRRADRAECLSGSFRFQFYRRPLGTSNWPLTEEERRCLCLCVCVWKKGVVGMRAGPLCVFVAWMWTSVSPRGCFQQMFSAFRQMTCPLVFGPFGNPCNTWTGSVSRWPHTGRSSRWVRGLLPPYLPLTCFLQLRRVKRGMREECEN